MSGDARGLPTCRPRLSAIVVYIEQWAWSSGREGRGVLVCHLRIARVSFLDQRGRGELRVHEIDFDLRIRPGARALKLANVAQLKCQAETSEIYRQDAGAPNCTAGFESPRGEFQAYSSRLGPSPSGPAIATAPAASPAAAHAAASPSPAGFM